MKKLESLKKFQITNETKDIFGGGNVSGSFTFAGSLYSYDGTLSQTQTSSVSMGVFVVYTEHQYCTDFCGSVSVDGSSFNGCYTNVPNFW